LQRVVSLALVMCGLVLGMLLAQRPWAPSADAAAPTNRTSVECIGYDTSVNSQIGDAGSKAELYVFNQGNGAADITVTWRKLNGGALSTATASLNSGAITELNTNSIHTTPVLRASIVGSNNRIWADGRMNWNINDNEHQTQILCIRNPGASGG
jgi:hypothetical protein